MRLQLINIVLWMKAVSMTTTRKLAVSVALELETQCYGFINASIARWYDNKADWVPLLDSFIRGDASRNCSSVLLIPVCVCVYKAT